MVALLLGAAADDAGQAGRALQPLGDEDLGALGDDVRDHDVGVVAERLGEGPLRLGLELVVELVDRARLHLLDQGLDVDARHQRRDGAAEPADLAQVGHQRLPGAGVLDLDRDIASVVPAALVHLADARRRGRAAVHPDELVLPVRAQALRDLVADGLGRHRRRGVLQPGQLFAIGAGDLLGQRRLEHAQRLTELHRPALELAEGPEQLLGGPLLDVGQHRLGRRPAQPLAEPERGAPGVPQRQGRQSRRARGGLAGQVPVRHGAIVPDPSIGVGAAVSTRPNLRRLRYRQVPWRARHAARPRSHCPDAHFGTGVEAPPACSGRSVQGPIRVRDGFAR